MEHILETSHLGILQQMVRELILARDSDAYFTQKPPDKDPVPWGYIMYSMKLFPAGNPSNKFISRHR